MPTKELEFQQNAQLRIVCDLWKIWQQWQCHSDVGEISGVENYLDCLYGETGKFQLYVFSYGTEMPAWKEK
jgi:hypothetical protein